MEREPQETKIGKGALARLAISSDKEKAKTSVLLSYELTESEESFRAVAEQIIDSYNDSNKLRVFGEKPPETFNYEQYIADETVITGFESWALQAPTEVK